MDVSTLGWSRCQRIEGTKLFLNYKFISHNLFITNKKSAKTGIFTIKIISIYLNKWGTHPLHEYLKSRIS